MTDDHIPEWTGFEAVPEPTPQQRHRDSMWRTGIHTAAPEQPELIQVLPHFDQAGKNDRAKVNR